MNEEKEVMVLDETYEVKQKNKKKMITVIASIIFLLVVIVIIAVISSHNQKMQPIKNRVAQIETALQNGEYSRVLTEIQTYKDLYSGTNEKYDAKVNSLIDKTEEEIYAKLPCENATETIDLCNVYIENYPNGKHLSEVKDHLASASKEQAEENLVAAKTSIEQEDYTSAYYDICSVVDNTYADANTKKEAEELLEGVMPMYLILGTWNKDTGVSYTFEADGHMSTDLAQTYDSSAGTTLDGLEVKTLLGDIEDFGRCVHGGTWKYTGKYPGEDEMLYTYSLFYNGSMHQCYIGENTRALGIMLSSGLGDMSLLWK